MYVGTDFVGRMTLPQVAVGEQFTVGFGVDPQLQIGRRLVKKADAVQGGNQVHTYEFRIVVRNFKAIPATAPGLGPAAPGRVTRRRRSTWPRPRPS